MSTGRLRVRIRAYEREEAWAPDYVANKLAGSQQAADITDVAEQRTRDQAEAGPAEPPPESA
jgi:hypothetical protein